MTSPAHDVDLAQTAVELWRGAARSLRRIGDSANRVYSFTEAGRSRYLRLTSSADRTRGQIEAELDFIAHLRRGGVSAAAPVASSAGRLVEEVAEAGGGVFACVFEEAEGERFRYHPAAFNEEHFRLRGRTLGRIHALSKAYVPSGAHRRFAWNEDRLLLAADDFLPPSERVVWRAFDELRERLHGHPKSEQTFGLIHGDFGETNYRAQDNHLNVFDFDDSCYHWFAYDLAVTIYPHGWRREGRRLLDSLLEGYAEDMRLEVTLAEVTMFCRWRLLYMFLVYARRWGFAGLSEQQAAWFARQRENIAHGYVWAA